MTSRQPSIIVYDMPQGRVFWQSFHAENGTIMFNNWSNFRESAAEFSTAREADNTLRAVKRTMRIRERRYVKRRPTSDNRAPASLDSGA